MAVHETHEPPPARPLAIVFGGGGARAAYQVGVLRWIAHRVPRATAPILVGISMGAINAAHMARCAGMFADSVESLVSLWSRMDAPHVFRTGVGWLGRVALRRARGLLGGGPPGAAGLLDVTPLRAFLTSSLGAGGAGLAGVAESLYGGRLRAIGVMTTDVVRGRSTTWFQGPGPGWEEPLHRGVPTTLGLDHILASLAAPVFFPPVRLAGSWHADGAIRRVSPLEPAMRLGAGRVLAISSRPRPPAEAAAPADADPSASADVGGVLFDALFRSMLDEDARALERMSALVEKLPEGDRPAFRPGRALVLRPSRDLGAMAVRHLRRMPGPLRLFGRALDGGGAKKLDLFANVAFDPEFVRDLIALGEADADARGAEIEEFIGCP